MIARSWLLDHFQRRCALSPRSLAERGDHLSSWKFVFFYRCTDKVSFAPLQSQGVKYRKELIRKTTVTTAPPPCSPKTIYVLASSVRQPSAGPLVHDIEASIPARNPISL